jgi:hypothetical protein
MGQLDYAAFGWDGRMILPAMVGLTLWLTTAAPAFESGPNGALSSQQKVKAVQPSVSRATECVAHAVADNPHYASVGEQANIGDLIVESMSACAASMRMMIETYDRYFGEGAGETFFSGPYLDVLPTAVSKRAKDIHP